jgi:hypothetical protein
VVRDTGRAARGWWGLRPVESLSTLPERITTADRLRAHALRRAIRVRPLTASIGPKGLHSSSEAVEHGYLLLHLHREREASMSCERLAMGPLLQRDIENLVAVLLRGLKRQAEGAEPPTDETAPPADSASSATGARAEPALHVRSGDAKRKPSPRPATARRKR